MVVQREGFLVAAAAGESHSAGDKVIYSCPEPGQEVVGATSRICQDNGKWEPELPYCGSNLALGGRSLHSATLPGSSPALAIDGDQGTCARTPRTEAQRWWQVALRKKASVRTVRIVTEGQVPALTVFVIELLEGNRTLYKPCGRHLGSHEGEGEVTCGPADSAGHFLFLRDDRKAEEEFKLCEVIVFGAGGGELAEGKEECGDPELGMGAVLEGPSRSHERKVVCSEGLELEGGGSSATIRCQDGRWNSSSVHCRPPSCQTPPPVKGAKVEVLGSRAIYSCSVPGTVLWGAGLTCADGQWKGRLPSCSPLSCGEPPSVQFASHSLGNSSFLVGELAVYTCHDGFLMVVNSSNSPVATEQAAAMCLSSGSWGPTHHLTCVDASQLGKGWLESASLSINIIYILLALLTVLTVPLLLLHCCGRRLCSSCPRESKKPAEEAIWSPGGESGSPPSPSSPPPSSNPSGSGLYSVSSGLVIQPATISPSTLRSLSSSSNTFKPFSYTAQPHSVPYPWHQSDPTRPSVAFQFDSSPQVPSSQNSPVPPPGSPTIDEAGYASLVSLRKETIKEPIYEPISELRPLTAAGNTRIQQQDEDIGGNTYDSVPPITANTDHLYANTQTMEEEKREYKEGKRKVDPTTTLLRKEKGMVRSSGSYPDLLEMVTRSGSPGPREQMGVYAKVDLSRKRSRPNSDASTIESSGSAGLAAGEKKDTLDSYTRTLIDRFNSFLETEGHSDHRKPM